MNSNQSISRSSQQSPPNLIATTLGIILPVNTANAEMHAMTVNCIASLMQSKPENVEMTIVILEGNMGYIETSPFGYDKIFPEIKIIPNPGKFNFNEAVRGGLSYLTADGGPGSCDYFLVTNNDVIYSKDCLTKMIAAMDENDAVSSSPCPGPACENKFYVGWDIGANFFGWSYMFYRSVLDSINIDELFPVELEFWYQDNQYIDSLRRHNLRHVMDGSALAQHLHEQSHKLLGQEELWAKTSGARLVYEGLKSRYDALATAAFKAEAKLEQEYEKTQTPAIQESHAAILLTIAIAGLTKRVSKFSNELIADLEKQCSSYPGEVELLALLDNKVTTIGYKRDWLIQKAKGKYIIFVDDDDKVADYYIQELMNQIKATPDVDCIVFDANVYIDNAKPKICSYSIHNEHRDLQNGYLRQPNQICCIKREHALKVGHLDMSWGEDNIWAFELVKHLETESRINRIMYHYYWRSDSTESRVNMNNPLEVNYAPEHEIKKSIEAARKRVTDTPKKKAVVSTGNKGGLKIAVYAICKNESQNVSKFLQSVKDADEILIVDTGSEDNTYDILLKARDSYPNLVVHSCSVIPWRFDVARNTALSLVSKDIDVCIKLDMDETIDPGWREAIEKSWTPATTRLSYWFNYGDGLRYHASWIHARNGYVWKWPVHELLHTYLPEVNVGAFDSGLSTTHERDMSKPRDYLPMLKSFVIEERSARSLYYLGREYTYHGMAKEAIETLRAYLTEFKESWDAERCDACCMTGDMWGQIGNTREQENAYLDGVIEDRSSREPLVRLAMLYYKTGRPQQALVYALSAIAIKNRPGHHMVSSSAWNETPYDIAAICFNDLGMLKLAIENWMIAAKLSPGNERIINNLMILTGESKDDVLRKIESWEMHLG